MRKRLFIEQTVPLLGSVIPCMVYIGMGVEGGKTIVKPCTMAVQERGVAARGEQLHARDENIILARQMEYV